MVALNTPGIFRLEHVWCFVLCCVVSLCHMQLAKQAGVQAAKDAKKLEAFIARKSKGNFGGWRGSQWDGVCLRVCGCVYVGGRGPRQDMISTPPAPLHGWPHVPLHVHSTVLITT